MVYLRNRYYDPSIGRFISEDPARANGGNWYTYCMNNPVNYKDPTGLWMEGDELLTQGAQTYTIYYGQQWELANQRFLAATTDAERVAAQADMDNWHALANDIRTQDAAGTVQGVTLNVPIYDQLAVPGGNGTNLCWAASAAMFVSLEFGDTTDRTEQIAINVAGVGNPFNVPRAWQSTDTVGVGSANAQTQFFPNVVFTEAEIQTVIDSGVPFATLYHDGTNGHWVTGIGYATATGHDTLIVSNDPWGGVQRIQTYNDFQTYVDGRPWIESVR